MIGDIILGWFQEDGYSLSEAGRIRARDQQFYFEVTAEKNGHRHIARVPDRETAIAELGTLMGYPLDEQEPGF